MTSKKEYISVEPSNDMKNVTDNKMVENSVQNPSWPDEDNHISVVSEDRDRVIKFETDILDDCTWLSKIEISKANDQNNLELLHQNASNSTYDSTNESTNHLNREDSALNSKLETHMMEHQIPTQVKYEPYKCIKCGKQFKLNFSLNIHVKKYHLDLCKCDICSDFIDKTIINEHMKTHENNCVEEKTDIIPNLKLCKLNGVWKSKPNCVYKCNRCFEKFYHENQLVEHMEIHKNNDDYTENENSSKIKTQHTVTKLKDCNKKISNKNIYKCPKCLLSFDSKQLFVRHSIYCSKNSRIIWNKYRGKFKTNVTALFSCEICGISFQNTMLLKTHMNSGCLLHKCKNCGQTFNTKMSWLKHVNLKQCVNSFVNVNKTHSQNFIVNDSSSKIKPIQCTNVKKSDQIYAANKNKATLQTRSHNLTVNDSSLNINQEKSAHTNTIENSSRVPTNAVNSNSNASISQTVPDNLKINNISSNIKKEKNIHENSSGLINEKNCNESITQMQLHSSIMYDNSLKIKKEKSLSKDAVDTNNSDYSHQLNSIVASNVQCLKPHLVVKKEPVCSNTNNSCIERETVYFSILKSHGNFVFICKICNNSSCKDLHSLALHISDHIESSMHECIVCDKTFETVRCWTDHMTYHQEQMDLNLSNFTSNSGSMNSQDGFTGKKQNQSSDGVNKLRKQFYCTICLKTFYSSLALTVHHQTVHSDSQTFSCRYCNRKFSLRGPCTNHEKSHTSEKKTLNSYNAEDNEQEPIGNQKGIKIDNNVNVFTCKYCVRMFSNKAACTNHEKSHISEKNNLNSNSTEDNEQEPIGNQNDIKIDNNVNVFTCKYCVRMFTNKAACTNHEKSHISEKNNLNSNSTEDNKLSSIGNQNDIKIDNNVKVFTCKYCVRMFSNKAACTNHEKSHISETNNATKDSTTEVNEQKPNENQNRIKEVDNQVNVFGCKYCNRMFCSKGACTNHEKSHTSSNKLLHNTGDEENETVETQDNIKIETSNINSISIIPENRNMRDKLICYICGKKFLQPRYRTKHMVRQHKINPNSPDQLVDEIKIKRTIIKNKKYMNTTEEEKITEEHSKKSSASECFVNEHLKNSSISCSICKKRFAHHGALSSHIKTHSDFKPFECQYCNRTFSTKGPLTRHERYHKSNEVQSINTKNLNKVNQECIEEENENHELVSNTLKGYPVNTQASSSNDQISKNNRLWFACDVCGKKFSTPFQLIIHRKSHSSVEPYVCKICDKSYNIRHCWNRHIKSHYARNKSNKILKSNQLSNNLKPDSNKLKITPIQHKNVYTCGYCKKEFRILHYWKKHLSMSKECRRHCKRSFTDFKPMKDEESLESQAKCNKFQCNICKKLYSTAYNRKIHLSNVHKITDDNISNECIKCGKTYSNRANLQRHYSINHVKGNANIKCDECGKTFKHKYTYREHIRLKNLQVNVNKKATCNFNYNKTAIKKYSVVKYVCKICKMEFSDNKQLQKHIRMHMAIKYKCNDCGQQFDSNVILGKHILENHKTPMHIVNDKNPSAPQSLNDWEVQCTVCFKILKTSAYLTSHMRLHSGSKPFKCDVCNMTFRFSSNLKIHKSKHHSENILT